jgi:predicted ATPase/DNA-binding SARP family transcriptional activator
MTGSPAAIWHQSRSRSFTKTRTGDRRGRSRLSPTGATVTIAGRWRPSQLLRDAIPVKITTLGPLAIEGKAVEGSRLTALLRPLLLARGRIVAATDLVEAVWTGTPPADATGALRALVARSRRLGLTIKANAGGYRLDPRDLEIDSVLAQDRLVGARAARAAGDHTLAANLAALGLTLWPTDDATPAAGASGRLFTDLLTIRVEGALAALDETTGSDAHVDDDIIDMLREAVGYRPADEPLTALLMRALAARGRESEALSAYVGLSSELAETFGTDPSGVVAQTHLALLRGELSPASVPLTSRASPPALPRWRRPITSMLGRETDVVALEHKLATHTLVTLTAVGGAGKTRLAVEVARRATERGECVRAVELASVRDPAEILPTLLSVLGAAETTSDTDGLRDWRVLDPREQILRAVASLDGLLVLDNCEHLLIEVAEITAQLLEVAGPGLHVLATSRAPLGLAGEAVYHVDTLPDDVALDLLRSRGQALRPSLAWDAVTALELCHRLDNLPLALELAAGRLRSMPLEDLLTGVEHRFALLDDAVRGLPDQHQGLWAMVDWSWALLDPASRGLLRDLAVVPAPFTADLATWVATDEDADGARAGLAQLVDQSLLALEESGDGHPARYRMLETVREYGEARLNADGDRDMVMGRLAGWAAQRARALRKDYVGQGQLEALRATSEDHDTLLAALRWSVDRTDDPDAFAVAAALFTFWTIRGLHVEVITWANQLLDADSPTQRRARWQRLRTMDNMRDTDAVDTVPDADDAAALATMAVLNSGITNNLRTVALAMRLTCWSESAGGDGLSSRTAALAKMTSHLRSQDHGAHLLAAGELINAPDPYLHAIGLLSRANIHENQGDIAEFAIDAQGAYAFFEAIGDHWGMGMAAGMAAQAVGRSGTSGQDLGTDQWLTLAIKHFELVGAAQDVRRVVVFRDMHWALNGSAEAAARLAATVASPSASAWDQGQALIGLGVLAAKQGRWEEAAERADAAVSAARSEQNAAPQGRIMTEVAAAVLRIRAGHDAGGLLAVAAHGAFAISDMPVLGSVALGYAELNRSRGDTERSDQIWALGMRLGANLAMMLGSRPGVDQLLMAANDTRADLLEQARSASAAETVTRLAMLISPS